MSKRDRKRKKRQREKEPQESPTEGAWLKPKPATILQQAFGPIRGFLPEKSEIPEEFWDMDNPLGLPRVQDLQ